MCLFRDRGRRDLGRGTDDRLVAYELRAADILAWTCVGELPTEGDMGNDPGRSQGGHTVNGD